MATRAKGFFKGTEFAFDLPGGWDLLAMAEPKLAPALADVGAQVRALLAKPYGMAPLAEIVRGLPNRRTVIISEDHERPSPVPQVLLPLLAELNRLGISDSDIDLVIGLGTHRPPTDDEIRAKLGAEALRRLRVSVHNADAADLVYVGTTRRGTQVRVNRLVGQASLIFGIGTINPHYFAGYGGGPKLVLPGVSGRETIKQNHVWIRDPKADAGVMDGNPIWEDMLEASRLARLTMKFDLLLNSRKEITRLFGGEVEAQQRAAVAALKEVNGVAVPARADVTITCGYPLEMNLIQSGKSILLADTITKSGGTIVLVSSCESGAGPLMHETLSQRPTPEQVIEWIGQGKANTTGGPMASRLRKLVQTKRLVVISEGLSKQQLSDMAFEYAPSLDAALADLSRAKPRQEVIVLPVGGSTYPYLAQAC